MGTADAKREDYGLAEQHFRDAIRFDPDEPGSYHLLARCLMDMNNPAEAEVAARNAVQLAPYDVPSNLTLAAALAAQGKQEAFQVLKSTIKRRPNAFEPYRALAELYTSVSMPDQALAVLRDFLAKNPNSPYLSRVRQLISQLAGNG
jgi:predicted Zn-dependent protease